MKFSNEKEFEFNVYKDLIIQGIYIKPLEQPFDSKFQNQYIEFKMSTFNPKYHRPMIKFTEKQTEIMRKGEIPIILVCGETRFYLLSTKKVEELINDPGRRDRKRIWISEKYFKDVETIYNQMITKLIKILESI